MDSFCHEKQGGFGYGWVSFVECIRTTKDDNAGQCWLSTLCVWDYWSPILPGREIDVDCSLGACGLVYATIVALMRTA